MGCNTNLSLSLPIFVSRPFRCRTPNAGLPCAVIPCCQSYSWPWFPEHEHSAMNVEMLNLVEISKRTDARLFPLLKIK